MIPELYAQTPLEAPCQMVVRVFRQVATGTDSTCVADDWSPCLLPVNPLFSNN